MGNKNFLCFCNEDTEENIQQNLSNKCNNLCVNSCYYNKNTENTQANLSYIDNT